MQGSMRPGPQLPGAPVPAAYAAFDMAQGLVTRAEPVNRSVPKTPGNLPLSAAVGLAESAARMGTGGEGVRPESVI